MDGVLREAHQRLGERSSLAVVARGLGLARLVRRCVQAWLCDPSLLVLVLNASPAFCAQLSEGLLRDGLLPSQAPRVRTHHTHTRH